MAQVQKKSFVVVGRCTDENRGISQNVCETWLGEVIVHTAPHHKIQRDTVTEPRALKTYQKPGKSETREQKMNGENSKVDMMNRGMYNKHR